MVPEGGIKNRTASVGHQQRGGRFEVFRFPCFGRNEVPVAVRPGELQGRHRCADADAGLALNGNLCQTGELEDSVKVGLAEREGVLLIEVPAAGELTSPALTPA